MQQQRERQRDIVSQIQDLTEKFIHDINALGEMQSDQFEALNNNYMATLRQHLQSYPVGRTRRLRNSDVRYVQRSIYLCVEKTLGDQERYIIYLLSRKYEPQRLDDHVRLQREVWLLFDPIQDEVTDMLPELDD